MTVAWPLFEPEDRVTNQIAMFFTIFGETPFSRPSSGTKTALAHWLLDIVPPYTTRTISSEQFAQFNYINQILLSVLAT